MFIVIEGIDYAGKTTVVNQLTQILQENNISTINTREPGGDTLGEAVRTILVSEVANKPEDKDVWGILLAGTRIAHGRHVINPALKEGKVVICSRYIYSTKVYQPEAMKYIRDITHKHPDVAVPDLVILCDVSIDIAKQRKLERSIESPDDHDHMDDMWVPEWEAQRERFKEVVMKLGDAGCIFNTESPLDVQYENLKRLTRSIGFDIK